MFYQLVGFDKNTFTSVENIDFTVWAVRKNSNFEGGFFVHIFIGRTYPKLDFL